MTSNQSGEISSAPGAQPRADLGDTGLEVGLDVREHTAGRNVRRETLATTGQKGHSEG
jgi:hypothetical protein